jgi:hypothetical protein
LATSRYSGRSRAVLLIITISGRLSLALAMAETSGT